MALTTKSEKKTVKNYAVQLLTEGVALTATTLSLLAVFVVSGLATAGPRFGFKNGTGNISDLFFTQVTPAGWTFAIWGVIYTYQVLWLGYAWSFVCRPKVTRTISLSVYPAYIGTCVLNILWLYAFGNEHVDIALTLLVAFNAFMYLAIGLFAVNFERVSENVGKVDTILSIVLPLNGLSFYATWTTIASLVNLAVVLQYSVGLSPEDSATTSIVILGVTLLVYFIAENTIWRNTLKNSVAVYIVVIWALAGVLSAQWGQPGQTMNNVFVLLELLLAVLLLLVRVGVVVGLAVLRWRNRKYKNTESEKHV